MLLTSCTISVGRNAIIVTPITDSCPCIICRLRCASKLLFLSCCNYLAGRKKTEASESASTPDKVKLEAHPRCVTCCAARACTPQCAFVLPLDTDTTALQGAPCRSYSAWVCKSVVSVVRTAAKQTLKLSVCLAVVCLAFMCLYCKLTLNQIPLRHVARWIFCLLGIRATIESVLNVLCNNNSHASEIHTLCTKEQIEFACWDTLKLSELSITLPYNRYLFERTYFHWFDLNQSKSCIYFPERNNNDNCYP